MQSKRDLKPMTVPWFVSQQKPTDHQRVNSIDVTKAVGAIAGEGDSAKFTHIRAFEMPPQPKKLVLDTSGVIRLGELLAEEYLKQPR